MQRIHAAEDQAQPGIKCSRGSNTAGDQMQLRINGRRRSEIGVWRSELGSRSLEVGVWRSEFGGWSLEVGGQRTEVGGRTLNVKVKLKRTETDEES